MRPALILASLAALAPPASADTLLEKARGASLDGPAYLFDMLFDDGAKTFTFKVDQSRAEGDRVVSVSPPQTGLEGEEAKRFEKMKKDTKGDIWCNSFTESIPASAKRVSETGQTATYSFKPVADEEGEMKDIVKYLTGSATLDKASGQILKFELSAPKAFKPAVVAKVDAFSMSVACKAAPDGRTHVDTFAMNVSGSAMMKPFSQTEKRRVSNLVPVAGASSGAP